MDPSKDKMPPYFGGAGQPYPPAGYPQGGYPQGGYPQGGYPQGGYPQAGYPAGSGFPGMSQPGQGMPQMGFTMPIRPSEIIIEQPEGDKGPQRMDEFDFTDKTIRRGFIRKVYAILAVMLTIVTGFIMVFSWHEGIRDFSRRNSYIHLLAFVALFITTMVLACCDNFRRKAPGNFICLGIFTLAAGVALGTLSSFYKAESVMLAAGITAVVCLGLSMFAFQTKWDFTKLNGALFVALIVLVVLSFVGIFFRTPWMHLLIAGFSAILFSLYLIHDTQMIMGGNHKLQISPEEYIFAALTLFLDIYNIFVSILALVGDR